MFELRYAQNVNLGEHRRAQKHVKNFSGHKYVGQLFLGFLD
jgi:hypothetical protein